MEILLLGSIVFAPLAFAAVEPWAFGPLYGVFFGLAAYLYVTGRALNPNPLYKNLLPAVLAVAAIGLLQGITENPVNAPASFIFTVWRPATLNAVVTWLFYAAVMYCVPQIIQTPAQLKRLLWTVFAMGVLIALIGMLQKTGENHIIYGLRRVRGDSFGPFVNRDHGASFLAMAAMAGLGLFFSGFRALAAQQSHTRFFDLLAVQFLKFVMLCAVVYGIYRTGSRGGLHSFAFAAAVTGFIAAGFLKTRKFKIAAFTGLTLLLAGYGIFVAQNKRLLGLDGGAFDSSIRMRFSMYKSSFEMLKDFPAFGVGLGAVEHAFPLYKGQDMPPERLVKHIHSDWLELFLQVGFAGGLIYLAGLLAALYRFARSWAGGRSFTIKALCGGALGAAAAGAAHNLVEFGGQMPANALLFYALLGALASKPAVEGPPRHSDEDQDLPAPIPAPRPRAAAAAALAVMLAAWAIPQYAAWRAGQLAKDAPFDQKIKFHADALKWAPSPQTAFRLGGDYYNQALTDKAAACPLFLNSQLAIAPYLRRAPANYSLNRLEEKLRYQLYRCYNPALPKPGAETLPAAGSRP
ncbi:MAG: hypothetical protein A2X35_07985 [Elusimicrobia bacterium GWA2_61_42]|nr:MAG: hypothetical protein A2X35_07985 [Elusimicrobia bacterium GWA2_61_42]OGR76031.1 MAG: hypothetical protein A2X38_08295 [Elusimicrobia bacterium GWC2_61_25]